METNIRRRQRQNVGAAFGLSLLLVLGAYFLLGFAPFGDDTILIVMRDLASAENFVLQLNKLIGR